MRHYTRRIIPSRIRRAQLQAEVDANIRFYAGADVCEVFGHQPDCGPAHRFNVVQYIIAAYTNEPLELIEYPTYRRCAEIMKEAGR